MTYVAVGIAAAGALKGAADAKKKKEAAKKKPVGGGGGGGGTRAPVKRAVKKTRFGQKFGSR